MKKVISILFGMAVLLPALACPAAAGVVHPGIRDFGGIHDLPHAAVRPNPGDTYKAIFDVTSRPDKPGAINPGLMHVARAVNVFASANVPLSHLHFVVILHGGAAPAALDNTHYREEFGTDNPNTPLLDRLKQAGVKLYVCGQAMYDLHYQTSWANPDVKVALSALSTLVVYGDKGYAYIRQ
ncbi:MAG TPA: DsrE family protein [Mariprofundaceae bacterium]|nr:DsrE family protein [Mariprofundaceae bacterium]